MLLGDPEARIPTKEKEGRGIENDSTGRLLCPIDYNWDNPEYVDNLYLCIPSNYFLEYMQICEMPHQAMTCPQVFSFVVYMKKRREILNLQRWDF
jgi:hypothetical protein